MGVHGEFTDFKFGNTWASEFGLVAVSSGSRYKAPIYGEVNANTSTVPGKRGVYKWESQINEKVFTINIAFDHLAIEDIEKIKMWLDPTKVDKLVFDNEPYKYYFASLSQDLDFSFLPFQEETYTVGANTFTHAVYKGEMSITFIAIDNYGYSDYDNFEQYDLNYIISEYNDEINFEDDRDKYILKADEINNNLQYYTLASGIQLHNENDILVYTVNNDTTEPVYLFKSNSSLNRNELQKMIDTLQAENVYLRYSDANKNYLIGSEDLQPDDNVEIAEEDGKIVYKYKTTTFNIASAFSNSTKGNIKPWVVGSNLLNSAKFYQDRNIFTSSLIKKDYTLTQPIYALNSGTAEARAILSFSVENLDEQIAIQIAPVILTEQTEVTAISLGKGITINLDLTKIEASVKQQLREGGSSKFIIEINGDICETLIKSVDGSVVANISKANVDNIYPILAPCKNVDYTKTFPTSSLGENSAISKTNFNKIYTEKSLNDFSISWRHTYL